MEMEEPDIPQNMKTPSEKYRPKDITEEDNIIEHENGAQARVAYLPVSEMPSKPVYGVMDPLEGSPSRELNNKMMSGQMPLMADYVKNLQQSISEAPETPLNGRSSRRSQSKTFSRSQSRISEGQRKSLSPLKKENLTNLPVRKRTKEVINSVQEILGYTELHPEVVDKILDLYTKIQNQEARVDNLNELVDELRGLSLWEIKRMIESKKAEMMSSVEENNQYVRLIQEELS